RNIFVYADWHGLQGAILIGLTGTGLTLNISENDNSLSLELALEVAQHFRIKPKEASAIMDDMKKNISTWWKIAAQYKLSGREVDEMAEAFYAADQ
ncbi:MAG: hypothetical protein V4708_15170, partial [Bacteroidota bacterium]